MSAVPMTTAACRHCRTPFEPAHPDDAFCCEGCRFVHHLLGERGLEEFYRYGGPIAPAHPDVFHGADQEWLRQAQKEREAGGGDACELEVEVQGISCAGCVWLLEQLFQDSEGSLSCQADSVNGTLRMRWLSGQCDLAAYAAEVRKFGYFLGPLTSAPRRGNRALVLRLGICGALAMNAMLFSLPHYLGIEVQSGLARLFGIIAFVLASLSFLIGGGYFFTRALAVLRSGALNIDVPIALGLVFAYAGSVVAWRTGHPGFVYFDFISIFSFLMLTGRWLQERALEANRARLLRLRVSPGSFPTREGETVPAEKLTRGVAYAVGRRQLIPVRSRLMEGEAMIGLSWITGEPHPRTMEILDRAAQIVEAGGIEAWSRVTAEEILGEQDAAHYTKSSDILEVWFDSGSTFWHVLRGTHVGLHGTPGFHAEGPEADLYLEGHDQHRGWFHSSLLLGCALYGRAPYRGLLTHGFTVDGSGRKMSKSLGNTVVPQEDRKSVV